MRPGPGLVVMALAFISGARRGSTSTSSKSYSSAASTSSSSAFFTSTTLDTSPETTSPSLLFPAYLGGGGVLTKDAKTFSNPRQQHTEGKNYRLDDNKYIFDSFYFLRPIVPPLETPTHDGQHLRFETLSGLKSSSRATRQTKIIRSLIASERNQNDADFSGGDNVNKRESSVGYESGSGYDFEDGIISVEDKASEGNLAPGASVSENSQGLPVQVPSNSADASQSFDEDDILALVAEDDLLSEESFDRLTKFTDDKIGYVVVDEDEDSNNGVSESSLTHSVETHQRHTQDDNYTTNERNIGNDNGSGENDTFQNEQEHTNANNKVKVSVKANTNQYIRERVYAENKENSHNSLVTVTDTTYVAALSENGLSHKIATDRHNRAQNTKWPIFDSESPLTRLNPWISACDLAQPGTAPDLQGQCSAGTLPMAWIDEGPGPPSCPISCQRLKSSIVNNFNTKFNNNNSSLINNYKENFKPLTKNHDDTGEVLKVRRDLNSLGGNDSNKISSLKALGMTETPSHKMANVASASLVRMKPVQAQQHENMAITRALTGGNRQHQANNNIVKVTTNDAESRMPYENSGYINVGSKFESSKRYMYNNKQKKQYTGYREQQQPLQQPKQKIEQQCLYYLGDTEETSPAHLCTFKSPAELAAQLRSLRLRHCCERNVFSALHTVALNATLSGGVECVRILMDVMDLDLLATRITCELAEILFRFDCRQVYSQIHQCDDCKEAYRRWVCSTLVPYFAEENDISVSPSSNNNSNRNNNKSDNRTTNTSTKNSDKTIINDITSNKTGLLFLDENNYNKLQNVVEYNMAAKQRTKRQIYQNISISYPSPYENEVAQKAETSATLKRRKRNVDDICSRHQQQKKNQEWQQGKEKHSKQSKQSNIFISTAINADPCSEDPVISKIIKRSKRRTQFRKRRRIRPCLSVCQTVEQKCPYLLPADRAPALPTQYAGEPTFLCLDQRIPETGEQLRKSSYGPAECCYSYCNNIAEGICTYCNAFIQDVMDASISVGKRRFHNITLTATSHHRLDARLEASLANDSTNKFAASISIALSNSSATAVGSQIDRLPYYALYDGVYYYDENPTDMPEAAMSDDCPPVPSVTSRCSIPYYASSAVALRAQKKTVPNDMICHHMLLLFSAMLCFLTSQSVATQLRNQKQLRKYILHRARPANISGLSLAMEHERSAAIQVVKKYTHLVLHSTDCLQQSRMANSISKGHPITPTIFPISTVCTYFSRGIYESDSVQNRGGRVHCCTENFFSRSRSRNKTKHRNEICKLIANRNRNSSDKGNEIGNRTGYWERKKISSTCYSGCVKYKHVQMNIGSNKELTYRLNSKLYFNSNTKIYSRKKCTNFIDFNIGTITDFNKKYSNVIIKTTTSNTSKFYYNYNYNNAINSIGRFKFYNTEKKYQFIYYYNFNINDWWRRWWWFPWTWSAQRRSFVIL